MPTGESWWDWMRRMQHEVPTYSWSSGPRTEKERLRAALERIAAYADERCDFTVRDMARAALNAGKSWSYD